GPLGDAYPHAGGRGGDSRGRGRDVPGRLGAGRPPGRLVRAGRAGAFPHGRAQGPPRAPLPGRGGGRRVDRRRGVGAGARAGQPHALRDRGDRGDGGVHRFHLGARCRRRAAPFDGGDGVRGGVHLAPPLRPVPAPPPGHRLAAARHGGAAGAGRPHLAQRQLRLLRRAHLGQAQADPAGEPREDGGRGHLRPAGHPSLRRGVCVPAGALPVVLHGVGGGRRVRRADLRVVAGGGPGRVALQARRGGKGLGHAPPRPRRRAGPLRLALLHRADRLRLFSLRRGGV
ncbi:MAG: Phosphatidate cytidylyltransferase, partial [uncultured Gemmatimonadetes bacterium]